MELFERNACDLSEMIKNKEISSAELTKSVFDRIKAVEGKVDAYLTLDEENAMKKAAPFKKSCPMCAALCAGLRAFCCMR